MRAKDASTNSTNTKHGIQVLKEHYYVINHNQTTKQFTKKLHLLDLFHKSNKINALQLHELELFHNSNEINGLQLTCDSHAIQCNSMQFNAIILLW